jgi:hypothetical protein
MFLLMMLSCRSEEKMPSTDVADPPAAQEDTESTDDVPSVGIAPRIHRLSHDQWRNAVEDLLGIDASSYSAQFIDDPLGTAFDNNGDSLGVGPALFKDYQRAAEGLAWTVVRDLSVYGTVVSEDPREGGTAVAFSERYEAEDAEATAGGVSGDRYILWTNGTLSVEVDLASSGSYVLTALVEGTECDDGLGAEMQLLADGELVASANVLGEQEVSGELTLGQGTHTLSVSFANDCYVPEMDFDRNLYIDWIELEGGTDLGTSSATEQDMYAWVERFGHHAFRRPLDTDEVALWTDFYDRGPGLFETGDDIADGVQLVVLAMLQSPDFVYRIERTAAGSPLDNHELAAKLSFQLCSQPPDEELREAALGDLHAELRDHAERLLVSDCGKENILDMHRQLLHLDSYENIYKNDDAWNQELNGLMKREIEEFVSWLVFHEDGTLRDLYTAGYTVANAEVAALYGAEGGDDFERIDLDPTQRAGLLTMSGVLAREADAQQSSPIHRGVFINTSVLCKDLPAPPDEVSGLPEQDGDMTNRERVEAHTGEGTCGEGCHSTLINPPGFAFENYDQLGRYRTEDNGHPVDASDSFYFQDQGVVSWTDGVGFAHILADSIEAHSCYASHLFSYLHGRELQDADQPYIDAVRDLSLADTTIRELVLELVLADSFLYRGVE